MLHMICGGAVGVGLLVALSGCAGTPGTSASGDAVAPARSAGSAADPACAPAPAVEEAFTARNRFGAIEGTLVLPAACGPRPVALIIAGSGPTDRNGNQATLTAQPYRLLASALAARGVGSLRYDKAGIAASAHAAPSESDLRFEMGADDAALLVTKLRADPRVGAVTIIGHSEGSLVGMLAAERVPSTGSCRSQAPVGRSRRSFASS